ncbi:MAG: ABC-type uncharacterized transport system permease subunit [Phenylobacterium sp.]|jgi:ABC-type uncharacterized transport system permease subunit
MVYFTALLFARRRNCHTMNAIIILIDLYGNLMLQNLLVITALVFYLLATTALLTRLFHADGIDFKRVLLLASCAQLAHIGFVGMEIFTPTGQDFSLINVISLVCLSIALGVTISALKNPSPFLLSVAYGFAAFVQLLTFLSLMFPKHMVMQHFFSNLPLTSHIALSLLAYCVLMIATLYAVQFRYINNKLKNKDLSVVSTNFPPLMQVEKQQFRLLTIGTAILTLALLSGFIYLDNMFSQSVAHKTILSMIAWAIFVGLILGRRYRGWRGKMTVGWTIGGAFIFTLAYFGSRFVREIVLGRF